MRLLWVLSLLTLVTSKVINVCPFDSNVNVEYYKKNKVRKKHRLNYKCAIVNTNVGTDNITYNQDTTIIPSFNCNSPTFIPLGLVLDYNFYKQYHHNYTQVVERVFSNVNFVYKKQFNTMFIIDRLIISRKNNNKWDNKNCKKSLYEQLDSFEASNLPIIPKYYWHLFTYCEKSINGLAGVAHIGGYYGLTNKVQWTVTAHELGHNLNQNHIDGYGIMTARPELDNVNRFNELSKKNICETVKRDGQTCSRSTCGNGIVEFGEECECTSGTHCKCCNQCKLTHFCDPLRNQCCTSECKYKSIYSSCIHYNEKGYCAAGYCQVPLRCKNIKMFGDYCGINPDNVCKVMCKHGATCSNLNGWRTDQGPVNHVVQGAICDTNRVCDGKGKCK